MPNRQKRSLSHVRRLVSRFPAFTRVTAYTELIHVDVKPVCVTYSSVDSIEPTGAQRFHYLATGGGLRRAVASEFGGARFAVFCTVIHYRINLLILHALRPTIELL
jgi:hypothetical protein